MVGRQFDESIGLDGRGKVPGIRQGGGIGQEGGTFLPEGHWQGAGKGWIESDLGGERDRAHHGALVLKSLEERADVAVEGDLDRHWVARQREDRRRPGPEGERFAGALSHAVKGGDTQQ